MNNFVTFDLKTYPSFFCNLEKLDFHYGTDFCYLCMHYNTGFIYELCSYLEIGINDTEDVNLNELYDKLLKNKPLEVYEQIKFMMQL